MKKPAKKPKPRRAVKHKDAMPMPTKIDMRPRKSTAHQRAQAERFWEAFGGKPKARKAAKPKRVAKPGVRIWVTQNKVGAKTFGVWANEPGESGGYFGYKYHQSEHRAKLAAALKAAGLKRLPKPGECIPVRMVILED